MPLPDDPFAFASVQTYPKDVEDDVLYFLHSFVTEVLENLRSETLFVVLLDNASLLDRASWNLLKLLYHSCPQLIVLACLQSGQFPSTFKISAHAFDFYNENLVPLEADMFNIFEVEAISHRDLKQLLMDLAVDYQADMSREIK